MQDQIGFLDVLPAQTLENHAGNHTIMVEAVRYTRAQPGRRQKTGETALSRPIEPLAPSAFLRRDARPSGPVPGGAASRGETVNGCIVMTYVVDNGLWLLAGACPPILYLLIYTGLRFSGKLCVSGEGWHAGGVVLGARVVIHAMRLFTLFQPLLRLESGLRRRLARFGKTRNEQPVSEVVVELVPIA